MINSKTVNCSVSLIHLANRWRFDIIFNYTPGAWHVCVLLLHSLLIMFAIAVLVLMCWLLCCLESVTEMVCCSVFCLHYVIDLLSKSLHTFTAIYNCIVVCSSYNGSELWWSLNNEHSRYIELMLNKKYVLSHSESVQCNLIFHFWLRDVHQV